jgi:hypothetical protein
MLLNTPSSVVVAIVAALAISGAAQSRQPAGALQLAVPGRANATPSIAAAGKFVAVAWGASDSNGKVDVFVATSADGGARFGEPVQVNTEQGEGRLGGEMPPRVSLYQRSASSHPDVVVLWGARGASTTIKLARSNDGGRTFQAPRELQAESAPGDRGWTALAVDRRGDAHAIWLDHRGLAGQPKARHEHGTARAHDAVAMAQRSALYFATVGTTARPEQALTTGVCYCCKTTLAVGRNGELFAAWRQVYPGGVRDIAFAMSRDGGRTFSSPVRVSEDGWEINACPDDGPSIAVDRTGAAHIVWPTVITNGGALEGALFHASTRDGKTFTRRSRVLTMGSPKPSHPAATVDAGGRLVVAWDEVIGGQRTAFVRSLRPAADPSAPSTWDRLLEAPGDHPSLATTNGAVLAAWTTGSGRTTTIAVQALPIAQPRRTASQ